MAIKQRKQLTGTREQINAYAGVEGQLVWDKTTKRLVGMSGTAGTNYPMAAERHQHSVANVTDLQKMLDSKATTTALTEGLAGKANKSHTHAVADVTGLQTVLNTINNKIPTKTSQLSNDSGFLTTHPTISVAANTLAAGSAATVTKSGTDAAPVFTFGIPKGADGAKGERGEIGPRGPQGPAGPSGPIPNAYVIETWHNGYNWYRKWSDGFIEQGGKIDHESSNRSHVTLNTLFSTTSYTPILTAWYGGSVSTVSVNLYRTTTLDSTGFTYNANHEGIGSGIFWVAYGY